MPIEMIIVVKQDLNFFGNFIHELGMTDNEKIPLRYNKILQCY